jgi:hypothetical protein
MAKKVAIPAFRIPKLQNGQKSDIPTFRNPESPKLHSGTLFLSRVPECRFCQFFLEKLGEPGKQGDGGILSITNFGGFDRCSGAPTCKFVFFFAKKMHSNDISKKMKIFC